jgi:hypothetical protein
MAKPLASCGTLPYPTLEQYRCGRRDFLHRVAVAAAGVGLARVLPGCGPHEFIDGEGGTLQEVRLPGTGSTSTYIFSTYGDGWGDEEHYLTYSATFTTFDEPLAGYYRSHDIEGITVMNDALYGLSCGDLAAGLATARGRLITALEENYASATGASARIRDLELRIVSCETFSATPGTAPEPSYP